MKSPLGTILGKINNNKISLKFTNIKSDWEQLLSECTLEFVRTEIGTSEVAQSQLSENLATKKTTDTNEVGQSQLPKCKIVDQITACHGTLTYANGEYVGEFKDGKKHGQGTRTWTWGDGNFSGKYVGEWVRGEREGQGTYTTADGTIQSGEWRDNELLTESDTTEDVEVSYKSYKDWAMSLGLPYHPLGCRFDLTHGCREKIPKKESTFNEFALSLGCGSKSKNVDDCVARYLPSIAGSGPLTKEHINEIKKDKELMGNVVYAIEAMNRAQSASPNQPPPREGAPQDQPNATSKAVWKSDSAGRWYWDYGNGFGYMPPNPQYDRILSGLSIGNQFKQQLYIGGGRGVTINSGRVNIW